MAMSSYGSAMSSCGSADTNTNTSTNTKASLAGFVKDPATAIVLGCSFVTGWLNAVFFVRYKAFATMMSGNYLMMAFSTALLLVTHDKPNKADPDSDWMSLLPSPKMYGAFLVLSLAGCVLHRIMVNRRGWTPSTFGPFIALGLFLHELISYLLHGRELHFTSNMAPFALICGVMNSVLMFDGVGTLPYCTTTNYTQMGDTLGRILTGGADDVAVQGALRTVMMLMAVQLGGICGICLDTVTPYTWDFELTLMGPILMGLYYAHDQHFKLDPALIRDSGGS